MKNIMELTGYAWECAIVNVGEILGKDRKTSLSEFAEIENIAFKLRVKFDDNGDICG